MLSQVIPCVKVEGEGLKVGHSFISPANPLFHQNDDEEKDKPKDGRFYKGGKEEFDVHEYNPTIRPMANPMAKQRRAIIGSPLSFRS